MEAATLMGGLSEGLVYVDEHLLVLDKPAGMLSVPGRGEHKQDCLSVRARQDWPDALVVHRLDMATSGLFVMGRGAAAQRALSMAFERREVGKLYVAVVAGEMGEPGWQTIDMPLGVDWPNRPRQMVDPVHGKPSITRWRAVSAQSGTTRVELEPLTGRSHQLRVHMLAIGHPIVGDPLYAPPDVRDAAPRLLLHAAALQLFHPFSGEAIAFESRAPF
jgi:tRNA pseudouridine32 synthase/23S rRNA pseudouridine746 synthase